MVDGIPTPSVMIHSMKIVDSKIPPSIYYNFIADVLRGKDPITILLKQRKEMIL
ncbi:MAG TPA: hypothetical protein VGR54_04765 [Nitrosopumilaceae archaeon]|nr:hypothetical protein [Nitrosopumilaceae archaeon]